MSDGPKALRKPSTPVPGIRIAALFCACLLPLWIPSVASAHSRLLSSTPVAGASLDKSPTEISLQMSEEIGVQFSSIKLYNQDRAAQALGTVERAGTGGGSLRVEVLQALAPGTYTVLWRVVSAVDGHVTAGTFAFRVTGGSSEGSTNVSMPTPLTGFSDTGSEGLDTGEDASNPFRWLLRGFILAAAALLTGGSLFSVLVTEPSSDELGGPGQQMEVAVGSRFARLGVIASAFLMLALVSDLIIEVGIIGQTGLLDALVNKNLLSLLLTSTRFGFAWSMKAIAATLLLAIFAALFLKTHRGRLSAAGLWEGSIAAGSFMLLAEALSSHGAAVTADRLFGLPLPLISDWLHLVTAATWAGGLAYMALVLFPTFRALDILPAARRSYLVRSVPRFSRLALLSVALLTLTGVYNLAVHSTNVDAIAGSLYGRVLGIKVAVFAILVALGAVNLVRLSPALATGRRDPQDKISASSDPAKKLGRNVRAELILVAFVLVCAGALTLLPPPVGARTTYSAESEHSVEDNTLTTPTAPVSYGPLTAESKEGGYRLTLSVANMGGQDRLTLSATPILTSSTPLTDVRKVYFSVASQELQEAPTILDGEPLSAQPDTGPGWQASGQVFTLAGSYLLNAVIQRTEQRDIKAAFRLTLSEGGGLIARAEPYLELRVSTDPSPPVVGDVVVTAEAVSSLGEPFAGATVTVSAQSSTALTDATPVPMQPTGTGSSATEVSFSRAGAWLLLFTVTRPGVPETRFVISVDVAAK